MNMFKSKYFFLKNKAMGKGKMKTRKEVVHKNVNQGCNEVRRS